MSKNTDRWWGERLLAFTNMRPDQQMSFLFQEVGWLLQDREDTQQEVSDLQETLKTVQGRLARVERIRSLLWTFASSLTKEGLWYFGGAVLLVLLLNGTISWDQFVNLISQAAKVSHGSVSGSGPEH